MSRVECSVLTQADGSIKVIIKVDGYAVNHMVFRGSNCQRSAERWCAEAKKLEEERLRRQAKSQGECR